MKTSEFDQNNTSEFDQNNTSEFDQNNTSEFDQNASQKISKVFISEFSGLGIVENGKFGGEKNILREL